ncbi:DUF6370 family protein [Litoribaculum gwangyangense]|uniref:DUF6370 family protein n=1 Tax=Litoribaculum gwangyangense TaxID=1130722 RepID=A0ABP9C392_9FLAO
MKNLLVFCAFLAILSCNKAKGKTQIVEVSCGQCQFGLASQKGCDLAVRIDEQAFFVDGAHIDDFGDAHDENSGFCEVIRKAEISGKIVHDRFQVSSINLLD